MKNHSLLTIFISMISLFVILPSCETAVIDQSPSTKGTEQQVLLRGDCMLCPDADECCCSVSLQPGVSQADINICGSISGGTGTCPISQVGICESSAGISSTHNLNTSNPRASFCSLVDGPLCIENIGSGIARIIITCQADQINPDTVWLQIPVSTTVCFQTDDECELEPCE